MNWRSLFSSALRASAKSLVSILSARNKPKKAKKPASQAGTQNHKNSTQRLYPSPDSRPAEWNIEEHGLPAFSYRPYDDNTPDPGEVIWTWVPYEENDGRGKDRPVLVLAIEGEYVFFVQMTSKDHADHGIRRDKHGTWWLDIGSGDWDPQGRPSEVKLSILWVVHQSQIRREGAALDKRKFQQVVAAIKKIHEQSS